jgi:peptidoglycan/xylan/chitin deacetylase (PgdA/CDA1 family)
MQVIKDSLSYILLNFAKVFQKNGVVILEYHRVSEDIKSYDVHSITPDEFYNQIKYLINNGYKIINLNEAIKILEKGQINTNKIVALTFDDGHKDNIRYAYPILKKLDVCATMFIVSDYVGCCGWLDESGVLNKSKSKSNKYQWWDILSWEDLHNISDHFIIEAHSKSHRHLTTLSLDKLLEELSEPKKTISKKLNKEVNFFCYPYGDNNKIVKQQTEALGYLAACSTSKGINYPCKTDYWHLKRNEVGRGISEIQFRLLLTDGVRYYNYLSKVFNQVMSWFK